MMKPDTLCEPASTARQVRQAAVEVAPVSVRVRQQPNRVLLVHCRYLQRGGEDTVFETEFAQLRAAGHEVERFELLNSDIDTSTACARIAAAVGTVWSSAPTKMLERRLKQFRPSIVHFHNTFPLLSPRAYLICRAASVPVIQTLHNFRLLCASAMFLREGRVCEDCMGRRFYRGAVHRCYRGSFAASSAVVAMQYVHHVAGTFERKVDRYIALSRFARERFVAGGLPADRIVVKPNSLADDPGFGPGDGAYALFVGRLSPEKGVRTLLEAWREVPGINLLIAGDGPLRGEVEQRAAEFAGRVKVLGSVPTREVYALMQRAQFLVVPSEWYEGFPMTIIESYACGTPVLAARIGGLTEVVPEGETGLHFESGNAAALARAAVDLSQNRALAQAMRQAARQRFENHYTAAHNVRALEAIYEDATSAPHHAAQ